MKPYTPSQKNLENIGLILTTFFITQHRPSSATSCSKVKPNQFIVTMIMDTPDTILIYGRRIVDYVSNRIISFLTRGVSINAVGLFSWTVIEIVIWNVAHYYLISFILEKWLHLDRRQTFMVMFL